MLSHRTDELTNTNPNISDNVSITRTMMNNNTNTNTNASRPTPPSATSSFSSTRKRTADDDGSIATTNCPSIHSAAATIQSTVSNSNSNSNSNSCTWKCGVCRADNLDVHSARCGVCRARRSGNSSVMERRESLESSTCGAGSLAGLESLAGLDSLGLDDLVHNLEGIDVSTTTPVASAANSVSGGGVGGGGGSVNNNGWQQQQEFYASANNSISGHNGMDNQSHAGSSCFNDSASRLSTGMWSLYDLNPWTCSMCTFENEGGVMGACDMCGTGKPPAAAPSSNASLTGNHLEDSKMAAGIGIPSYAEAERIRMMQEERMLQLAMAQSEEEQLGGGMAAAAAALSVASISNHNDSNSKPPHKPVMMSSRSHSPKPATNNFVAAAANQQKQQQQQRMFGTTGGVSDSLPVPTNTSSTAGSVEISFDDCSFPNVHHKPASRKSTNNRPNTNRNLIKGANLQDSAATERTFEMSSSTFNYDISSSRMDDSLVSPPQQYNQNVGVGDVVDHQRRRPTAPTSFKMSTKPNKVSSKRKTSPRPPSPIVDANQKLVWEC